MTGAATPRRHFWRRLVAYLVDLSIVWIAYAVLVALYVDTAMPDGISETRTEATFGVRLELGDFQPPVYLGRETCGKADQFLSVAASQFRPYQVADPELCFLYQFGIPDEGELRVTLHDPAIADAPALTGRAPVYSREPLLRYQDPFALLAYLAMVIACLRFRGQTPGKRLLGLRITGTSPIPAAKRELLRNVPWLLTVLPPALSLVPALQGVIQTHLQTAQIVVIAMQVIGLIAAIALWLVPLLRWRGAMPYDRWAGLTILRREV
jgi:uncharacterized RDD family membrane protein YckC